MAWDDADDLTCRVESSISWRGLFAASAVSRPSSGASLWKDEVWDEEELPTAEDLASPSPPPSRLGDPRWGASLSPLFHAPFRPRPGVYDHAPDPSAPDMATIARNTLAVEAPGLRLETIRGRGGGREWCRLRHVIIRRLSTAGYLNCQIAKFIGLSESTVSYVLRKPAIQPH